MLLVALAAGAGCGRLGYDPFLSGDLDGGASLDAVIASGDGGAGADAAVAPDYCAALPRLAATPQLDGLLEPGLLLRPIAPAGWIGSGSAPPSGQRASYAAAWRPEGLYVYLEVVDPDRVPAGASELQWCGDAGELFVDSDGGYPAAPSYDDPGARQLVMAAPPLDNSVVHRGEVYCKGCAGTYPQSYDGAFVARSRPDGYAVEVLVVGPDLGLATWPLGAGDQVGFDLAVDVSTPTPTGLGCAIDGGEGSRLGQYFLHISPADPFYPFNTPTAFCTATLLD